MIPITVIPSNSNPKLPPGLAQISNDELVLIELQGVLEVEYNHISERDGKLVGKLKIDAAVKKPTLMIGHHLLEGKIVTMPKPLAVLLRSNTAPIPRTTADEGEEIDESAKMDLDEIGQGSQTTNSKPSGWNVVAIVKRKIIFSKRPMPIVGRPT